MAMVAWPIEAGAQPPPQPVAFAMLVRVAMGRLLARLPLRSNRGAFDPSTMEGACAVTSYVIARGLCAGGVRARFVQGWWAGCDCSEGSDCGAGIGHCWVVVGPQIIDATATQFHPWAPPVVTAAVGTTPYYAERHGNWAVREAREWHRGAVSPFGLAIVQRLLTPEGADAFLRDLGRGWA